MSSSEKGVFYWALTAHRIQMSLFYYDLFIYFIFSRMKDLNFCDTVKRSNGIRLRTAITHKRNKFIFVFDILLNGNCKSSYKYNHLERTLGRFPMKY